MRRLDALGIDGLGIFRHVVRTEDEIRQRGSVAGSVFDRGVLVDLASHDQAAAFHVIIVQHIDLTGAVAIVLHKGDEVAVASSIHDAGSVDDVNIADGTSDLAGLRRERQFAISPEVVLEVGRHIVSGGAAFVTLDLAFHLGQDVFFLAGICDMRADEAAVFHLRDKAHAENQARKRHDFRIRANAILGQINGHLSVLQFNQ